MAIGASTPILGICAYGSGAGKTTLLTALIPELVKRGLRMSVVKHAHHSFDIDHPGKDSYRLREAGAVQMMIGSRHRWALMTDLQRAGQAQQEPELDDLLAQMDLQLVDLVLVEGFRHATIPKLEVHRAAAAMPLLASHDSSIIAVITDEPVETQQPQLDLNDIPALADFICSFVSKSLHSQHNFTSLQAGQTPS